MIDPSSHGRASLATGVRTTDLPLAGRKWSLSQAGADARPSETASAGFLIVTSLGFPILVELDSGSWHPRRSTRVRGRAWLQQGLCALAHRAERPIEVVKNLELRNRQSDTRHENRNFRRHGGPSWNEPDLRGG